MTPTHASKPQRPAGTSSSSKSEERGAAAGQRMAARPPPAADAAGRPKQLQQQQQQQARPHSSRAAAGRGAQQEEEMRPSADEGSCLHSARTPSHACIAAALSGACAQGPAATLPARVRVARASLVAAAGPAQQPADLAPAAPLLPCPPPIPCFPRRRRRLPAPHARRLQRRHPRRLCRPLDGPPGGLPHLPGGLPLHAPLRPGALGPGRLALLSTVRTHVT
jgi:hypothetical protein